MRQVCGFRGQLVRVHFYVVRTYVWQHMSCSTRCSFLADEGTVFFPQGEYLDWTVD